MPPRRRPVGRRLGDRRLLPEGQVDRERPTAPSASDPSWRNVTLRHFLTKVRRNRQTHGIAILREWILRNRGTVGELFDAMESNQNEESIEPYPRGIGRAFRQAFAHLTLTPGPEHDEAWSRPFLQFVTRLQLLLPYEADRPPRPPPRRFPLTVRVFDASMR